MEQYKSIFVLTKLKKNARGDALILDLPFRTYAENIMLKNKHITYRLHDLKNDKKEVLAKVDYSQVERPGTRVKDDTAKADALSNNLGQDWEEIKNDARYLRHYNIKKKDALATFDRDGNKTLYNGSDKEELSKFVQWDEEPEEAILDP